MKIGIVGVGMVGETLQYGFTRIGHDVVPVDPKLPETKLEDLKGTDLVFVCVPTPCNEQGECDVSIVDQVMCELFRLPYRGLVVIKSTVTPGTTDRLAQQCHPRMQVAFCPEFLREKSRYSDFVENHDVLIVGTPDQGAFQLIWQAHGSLPKKAIWLRRPIEAELAKYFVNTYNAMRITFANQFADVCQKAGADYTNIKNAVVQRQSIGDYYLESNKHFREFGGHCLPKDTDAFATYAANLGFKQSLFQFICWANDKFKREEAKENAEAKVA
jgi:UDPglucose 6-dehydrogenase